MLRFEHILERNEDPEFSKPVTFNLDEVFRTFTISNLREATLAANQWTNEAVRLKWIPDHAAKSNDAKQNFAEPKVSSQVENDRVITLTPMQIRTFVVNLQWRS